MASGTPLLDPKTGARKYLTADERRAFLEATRREEADAKFLCQLLYYTGCRLGEALQVTPARLDYSANVVTFRTLKQGRDERGEPRVRFRRNELPPEYLDGLQSAYSVLRRRRSKRRRDEPLWPVSDRTARRHVVRVMAAAGVTGPHANPRGLRHGLGVALALERVPVSTIQAVLGHSDVNNTMIYLHAVEDERRALVSRAW